MKKEPRYELVFSTRGRKHKKPLVERMAEAMEDIEIAHIKLREQSRLLKQLKP